MTGRHQPPLCRTCREPMWRSTHGFGVCPQVLPVEGGPDLMRLRVDGWIDEIVRVVARTVSSVTVETAAGGRTTVTASGVLFRVARGTAA